MGGYENWATDEVVGVFDIEGPDLSYQLIALKTGPETILPRLDFGICQIAFDGDKVTKTAAYEIDQGCKTFTLTRCDDSAQWDRSYRSEEHTSELQSLMRISYAVFCLQKKNTTQILNV